MTTLTKIQPKTQLMQEGAELLLKELGPSKASEFWNYLLYSNADYTKLRRKIFKGINVQTIVEQIRNKK